GVPPLKVEAPDEPAARPPEEDQPEPDEPPTAPRARRGAVPLVRGSAPDSSRDTHTSIKLPTAQELAAYPRRDTGGHRAAARHRAVADSLRSRRIKLAAAAAAAVVAAGLGGWALASGGDDAKANSRKDHHPGDTT